MHEGLESGLGLVLRDAGLQAAEGVHPAIAALLQHVFGIEDDDLRLHHDGNEDFRREAEFHPVETCLGNADDGHFVIIQSESLTDDLGITGETRLPEVVIKNNERMTAGDLIVFGSEDASNRWDDAKRGEVGAGNEFHGDAFGLLANGKARRSREAAKHVREDIVVVAKITEHGVGNGVAAPVVTVMAPAHGEEDELLRVLDRQETQ